MRHLWISIVAVGCGPCGPTYTPDARDDRPYTVDTDPPERPDDDTETGDTGCDAALLRPPVPSPGSTEVHVRPTLLVHLDHDGATQTALRLHRGTWPQDQVPDTPAIPLEDAEVALRGSQLSTRPVGRLAAGTPHTLFIDLTCRGPIATTFTTADVGSPVDEGALADRVYLLDPATFTVVEPIGLTGLGPSLAEALGLGLLLALEPTPTGEALDLTLGQATLDPSDGSWTQSCARVAQPPTSAPFPDDPYLDLDLDTVELWFDKERVPLDAASLTGVARADASELLGLTFTAVLDVRRLPDAVLDPIGVVQQEDVCSLLGTLTASATQCRPCDDGMSACLDLRLVNGRAAPFDGPLVPYDGDDALDGCPTADTGL